MGRGQDSVGGNEECAGGLDLGLAASLHHEPPTVPHLGLVAFHHPLWGTGHMLLEELALTMRW